MHKHIDEIELSIKENTRQPIKKLHSVYQVLWKAKSQIPSFGKMSTPAIPLVVGITITGLYNNQWLTGGTGVIIGERIAITAKHVLENFRKKWPKATNEGLVYMLATQMPTPNKVIVWRIKRLWGNSSDIYSLRANPSIYKYREP